MYKSDKDITRGGRFVQEGHRYHKRGSINTRGTQISQEGVGLYKRDTDITRGGRFVQEGHRYHKRGSVNTRGTQIPKEGVG